MFLTAAQCRAARALVRMNQDDLAKAAEVATKTIAQFETEARTPYPRTLQALRMALEDAGVEFMDRNGGGAGVRLK